MSFSPREIRQGMDVFSVDGVLLGSVVWIWRQHAAIRATAPSAPILAPGSFTGESLGPMPTTALGNGGPASQNPANSFATAGRPGIGPPAGEPAELLVFRTLVHLDWRTLRPRLRRYPVSRIQHVSHERIVLSDHAADVP